MKLYYSPGACSLASHIILNELGYQFDIEAVDLKTHQTASGKDFYAINPKGYIPALVLDNGKILTEGVAILSYLTESKGAVKNDKYETLEWLVFISTEVHKTLGSLFGLKDGQESVVKATKEKAAKRFDYLEKHLNGKQYILGNDFSAIDAYLFTVLNWCGWLSIDLSAWKNLSAYVARISQRPSVIKSLKAEGLIK